MKKFLASFAASLALGIAVLGFAPDALAQAASEPAAAASAVAVEASAPAAAPAAAEAASAPASEAETATGTRSPGEGLRLGRRWLSHVEALMQR